MALAQRCGSGTNGEAGRGLVRSVRRGGSFHPPGVPGRFSWAFGPLRDGGSVAEAFILPVARHGGGAERGTRKEGRVTPTDPGGCRPRAAGRALPGAGARPRAPRRPRGPGPGRPGPPPGPGLGRSPPSPATSDLHAKEGWPWTRIEFVGPGVVLGGAQAGPGGSSTPAGGAPPPPPPRSRRRRFPGPSWRST